MSVLERELVETPEEAPAPETPVPNAAESASPVLVGATALLAAAAAGWAAGGLFRGVLPRVAALLAAAIGAGTVVAAHRSRRPGTVQALGFGAILAAGVALALPGATSGLATEVADAVRGGGPSGEAMPFAPGWRLILVALVGALAAGGASLGIALGRPRLAAAVAVPPLVGASLVAPRGATVSGGVPAMALLLGALVVSYGVELAERGASTRRFEARRVVRGAIAIAVVAATLVALSNARVLFPIPEQERVIPPQLPPSGPALPDRLLFTVSSTEPGPWRLGVLDFYDGTAWRLPAFDPARLRRVAGDGRLDLSRPEEKEVRARFTLTSLPGQALPLVAGARTISLPAGLKVRFDPQTQTLRVSDGPPASGVSYEIVAAALPTGRQLAEAPAPRGMSAFLDAPVPPPEVEALLDKAPESPLWDRLQYVRNAFYSKVVAAGAGKPVAVPAARAAEVLAGRPASPYEISATEALLARWAGVPARIGYGFFQGDRSGSSWSVHPRHAATWLETYFEGYGWIPIVGVPPRAQASLGRDDQQVNPIVRPSEQLALVLYVPVRLSSVRLAYVTARYWTLVALPFVLGAALAWAFFPRALKAVRRVRRGWWARRRGLGARIAVAYAELRDAATDLNVADASHTPMEFVTAVAPDEELTQLSWLVSRALWGDLRRDLREADAEAAERMARSVTSRLRRARPATIRLLAAASRASLRDPYTREMPNAWPSRRRRPGRRGRIRLRRRPRFALPALLALAVTLSACSTRPAAAPSSGPALPERIVPAGLAGVAFNREEPVEARLADAGPDALVDAVRVFTFKLDGVVQGYLQVASFASGLSGTMPEVRRGVLQGIGAARFKLTRLGQQRVYTATIGRQEFALWFAPEGTSFQLLVSRRGFSGPLELFGRILEYQGRTVGATGGGAPPATPRDARRGLEA